MEEKGEGREGFCKQGEEEGGGSVRGGVLQREGAFCMEGEGEGGGFCMQVKIHPSP